MHSEMKSGLPCGCLYVLLAIWLIVGRQLNEYMGMVWLATHQMRSDLGVPVQSDIPGKNHSSGLRGIGLNGSSHNVGKANTEHLVLI